jgi:hypothetical protein
VSANSSLPADAQQRPVWHLQASPVVGVQPPCQARRRPLPGKNCPVALPPPPFVAFVGFVTVMAFPVGSTSVATFPARSILPLAGSSSSWLDSSLSWLSRLDPSIPLLFCHGRSHIVRRRRVCCRRPPLRGSSTTGRRRKQEGPEVSVVLLCHLADR